MTTTRPRVVFARIGAMRFYAGARPVDPKPVGGGSYNINQIGHEQFNFAVFEGHVYGYAQPTGSGPNLTRIDPQAADSVLERVLVVFVAGGKIVGWYNNATVHAEAPSMPSGLAHFRQDCPFFFSAQANNAVLIPTSDRTFTVPRGAGGMGQANLAYAFEPDGRPRSARWIDSAFQWIASYHGPNIILTPDAEASDAIEEAIELALGRAGAQGFVSDTEARRAIEEHAVTLARTRLEDEGWEVTLVGKPYDLRCVRGSDTLYVEVKGTQSAGVTVFLTDGEVEWARSHSNRMALVVVDSVVVDDTTGETRTSGGNLRLFSPWAPGDGDLRAISYQYRVPEHEG